MSEGGALREIAARFGIEFDDKALTKGVQSIGGAIDRLREFGQLLAANELVSRVREFADQFEEQAGRIEDTADTLGLSTTEMQALGYAAEQGGITAEQATAAWATLNRNIAGAAAGSKTQAEAFRALGVSVKNSDGSTRSLLDVTMDAARALDGIEDPARRAARAQALFGEGGRRLLTILKDGEGGVAALAEEFGQLGGGLTEDAIAAASAYGDEMNRQRVAMDGLRATVATALLPMLTEGARKTREWMVAFLQATRQSEGVKAALLVLGAVAAAVALKVLIAWAPVLFPLAKIALLIAAVVLIVDDLLVLFRGGDSAIGRFLESMVGVGASRTFVLALKEAWEGLKLVVVDVGGWMTRAWAQFQRDLAEAWQGFQLLFADIGRYLDRITFGIFRGLWEQLRGFFAQIGRGIARIPGFSTLADSFRSLGREWQTLVFNQNPATGAVAARNPGSQLATTPRAPARTTTVQQTNATTIQVHGAGDPAAVAREVERRQAGATQAALRGAVAAVGREAR